MRISAFFYLLLFPAAATAEVHTLTMRQAVERAITENPEVVMARMDEVKAGQGVRIAKDPFAPHVTGGSGLAYSNGFPLSIEGSAPAIFEARTSEELYNRPHSWIVAQAKENAKGASIAVGEKRDEIAYRVATLFLDLQRAGRLAESTAHEVESLEKVLASVEARVELGRELPVTRQEAQVNLLRAKQRSLGLASDRDFAARNLAVALGYGAEDTVEPVDSEQPLPAPPAEDAALKAALDSSKELKRLESNYQAKGYEIKSNKAQRAPRIDLVAQYALLSQYNNYDQYFLRFQRNNGEIGASIQIPILIGPAVKAQITQAEADQTRIRAEMQSERGRIALGIHQGYQDRGKADAANQLAKAEVDLAHEQLSVLLTQMNEGRATLRQVEDARANEDEKWILFYDAQFNELKARLNILHQTGELISSLR
ncbi:MAG TPA: TolC family protein [Bryobacteraceae bacterium]|nr:TolC family protein [Bryobacteraceae bacterium]